MSFISDFLGGSGQHSSQNQHQAQDQQSQQTQHSVQNSNINQSANQAANGNTTQSVNTLDAGTQALLKTLVGSVGKNASPMSDTLAGAFSNASPAVKNIQSLATNGTNNVDEIVQNAKDTAALTYDQTEGNQTGMAQQGIGSRDNSASELLAQKGARDKATAVAGAGTSAQLAAENTQANVSNSAAQALQSMGLTNYYDTAGLSSLIGELKGANTTGATSTNQRASSNTNSIANIISDLTGTGNSSGTAYGDQTSNTRYTPSLLDTIGGIMNLGNG